MSQITAKDIRKLYGDFEALSCVDIDVQDGEFLTLLGPSGSGKTTFLMILAGFTDPTSGQLFKNGVDISAVPAEDRNFGMVFQGYALFPHMSIWQNIAYPLRIRNVASAERKKLVDDIIEIVGLSQHAHKKPAQLSGGQQQRVALARSLVFKPDLLLLDEPLSALDRNLREQMQKELKRVHDETGTTFVFVTHDQGEALAMSDKIAIFNHGKLMQLDTPSVIYNQPNSRFVAEFLGQINMFPLSEAHLADGAASGRMGESLLSAPLGDQHAGDQVSAIAVRPEHMLLSARKPDQTGNLLQARVTEITYQGSHSDLTLETASGVPISVSTHSSTLDDNPDIGAELWIHWDMKDGIALSD